jgi:signal transduction histidine kinase
VTKAARTTATTASYVRSSGDLLADVAEAVSAPGDLRSVLPRLAELTLEATEADRVSFFLLDDVRAQLVLWAVAGQRRNDELWDRGMAMSPIPLAEIPELRQLFDADAPVAIHDGFASPLVPSDWAETFALASLVAAPMRMGDERLGLIVVDYREHRDLPPELVARVGAIARASALAVANSWLTERLAQRASGLQSLLDATKALLTSGSLGEVAEKVADTIVEVLGADHVSVHLLDERQEHFRSLVQRGVALPLEGTVRALPLRAAARVSAAWRKRHPAPVVLDNLDQQVRGADWPIPPELGCVLVLPLARAGGTVFGFVLAGLEGTTRPTSTTLELAGALASLVAFAVERARLAEQVAVGAELSCALLSLGDGEDDGPEGVLAHLRRAVPPAIGFHIVDVYVPAMSTPSRRPSQVQRQLWRQWRHRRVRPGPLELDDGVFVPVWGRDRSLGVMQALPVVRKLAPHQHDLLEAVASALGEVVERNRAAATILIRDRQLAVAAEQAQAASELHDIVGQLLVALEDEATGLAGTSGATLSTGGAVERITVLARAARDELRDRAASIESMTYDPRGLQATLSELVTTLSRRLDAAADLDVRGTPRPLPVGVEQALVRVLHEAFARVEQGARASAIAVRLEFQPGAVELLVRDDGVGLVRRDPGPARPGPHTGLRLIRERLEALGGRLTVERPGPRGLLLRAHVPV